MITTEILLNTHLTWMLLFLKYTDSSILVKTGVKIKTHIISIERTIKKLLKRFSLENTSSATVTILGKHVTPSMHFEEKEK